MTDLDEEGRAELFRANAVARLASIQARTAVLTPDPAPFEALLGVWQPIVEWQYEMRAGPVPTPEELQDAREAERRRQVARLPGLGSARLSLSEEHG